MKRLSFFTFILGIAFFDSSAVWASSPEDLEKCSVNVIEPSIVFQKQILKEGTNFETTASVVDQYAFKSGLHPMFAYIVAIEGVNKSYYREIKVEKDPWCKIMAVLRHF